MKNGDGSAVTGRINPAESRIELNDIRSFGHREKGDRLVFVEVEDSHQIILFAREKGAMVLGIECQAVISFAASYWIPPNHLVRYWINDRKNVLILQVDVDFARDRIVLRHSGLSIEMQRFDNCIFPDVHDR